MPARPAPAVPLWAALILAPAGGAIYDASFPELGLWPLAFVGLAVLLVVQIGRSAGTALLTGFLSGLAFWLIDVHWTALYLGPIPWLALAATESLFWAGAGLLVTLAYRWVPRAWPGRAGRLLMLPLVIAGLWTLREYLSDNFPFRGFAWGRAAYSQSDSPFTPLVAWIGVAGLTFVLVWISATAVSAWRADDTGRTLRASLVIAVIAVVLAVPAWPTQTHGTASVAAVQGDGPAGYFQKHNPGDVENAQIEATIPIVNTDDVDMVVWPEGSADVDPLENISSFRVLQALSTAVKAPLVVGAITVHDDLYYNASMLWGADGLEAEYDKQHPVPFGEYVPFRSFFHALAPHLVDLVTREYSPGRGGNVFDIHGIKAGISICFDIIDDWQLTQMVHGGAQLILAQTNNADFGQSKENLQQLAIARMRAVEASRSVVNISTVGTSQIIGPDGATLDAIPAYKPGLMVDKVPLSTAITPAMVDASGIEFFAAGLGLAGLVCGFLARRRPDPHADPAFAGPLF